MLPPLYSCEVCGHPLDPNGKSVLQLVTAWVRGGAKSVAALEDKHYRYRHEVCLRVNPDEQTLF